MFKALEETHLRIVLLMFATMWQTQDRVEALSNQLQTSELGTVLSDVKTSLEQRVELTKPQTVSLSNSYPLF
jgi:hypothetical protein